VPYHPESARRVLSSGGEAQGAADEGPSSIDVRGRAMARAFCAALDTSSLGVLILGADEAVWARSARAEAWNGADSRFELPVASEALAFAEAVAVAVAGGRTHPLWLSRLPGGHVGEFCVEVVPWPPYPRTALVLLHPGVPLDAERRASTRYETLGRLASSVVHDFNNLLTGLRGSIAVIRSSGSAQSRARALNAAETATQRAGEMIRQLLAFGRGPAVESNTASVELVLNETVQLVRCVGGGLQVCLVVEPSVGRVEMDPSQLHQVVLNLLMNAHEAVRECGSNGRVVIHAKRCARPMLAGAAPCERWVQLTVSDNGVGIAPGVRRRIFEPFFTTKTDGTGTGLGLANVRALVERVGGWIEVESEERAGSSFHVFLPLVEGEMTGPSETAGEASPCVLICDDETRLADLTAGLLEEFGYRAVAVAQGVAALESLAQRGPIHLVILDVNLSVGMSAAAVLRGMQDAGVTIPVILTSGLAPGEVNEELRRHPLVAGFLSKPYRVEDLTSCIDNALTSQRPHVTAG
jgi:signal transduction histidine kinase/CheY-like chemotaxis protein